MTQSNTRPVLQRYLSTGLTETFTSALACLDLSGLTILDFGIGTGTLTRLLKQTNAKEVIAFELDTNGIDQDILDWGKDTNAKPTLILNPPEYKINSQALDGDCTGYDIDKLIQGKKFAIIGNPPYFLWNRILSLTGDYINPEVENPHKGNCVGVLGVTDMKQRMASHPGAIIRAIAGKKDFSPPAPHPQAILQHGFDGLYDPSKAAIPHRNRPNQFGYKQDELVIGVPRLRIHFSAPITTDSVSSTYDGHQWTLLRQMSQQIADPQTELSN